MYPRIVWGLALLVALVSCRGKQDPAQAEFDASQARFAVPSGSMADQLIASKYPDATFAYYNSTLDACLAVLNGSEVVAAYDEPILRNIMARNPGLELLPQMITHDDYAMAVRLGDEPLRAAADAVIDSLNAGPGMRQMLSRWFPEQGAPAPPPPIETSGPKELVLGTAAVTEPFAYIGAQGPVGFDIELAAYTARKLGRKLVVRNMDFGALIPALVSGKVDMIAACITVSEERAKRVLFTKSYYRGGIAAVVAAKESPKPAAITTLEELHGKRIGVLMGSSHDVFASKRFPDSHIVRIEYSPDLLVSLRAGNCDAIILNSILANIWLRTESDLHEVANNMEFDSIGAGFSKTNPALRLRFDQFIDSLDRSGDLTQIIAPWLGDHETAAMSKIPSYPARGVLRVGSTGTSIPFSMVKDGQPAGIDMELINRFAAGQGLRVEYSHMPFASLIAALVAGKVDMIASSLYITPERMKQIDFSRPYYYAGNSAIVLRKQPARAVVEKNGELYASVDDVREKRIGVMTGSTHDQYITREFPAATVVRIDNSADLAMSLLSGKTDAILIDQVTYDTYCHTEPRAGVLARDVYMEPMGIAFSKRHPELARGFNEFLADFRKNGRLDSLTGKWLEIGGSPKIEEQTTDGRAGVLRMATTGIDPPFSLVRDGRPAGIDVELMYRFGDRIGKRIEVSYVNFGALIPALVAGKADVVACGITITPERAMQVDFSDTYYTSGATMGVLKKHLPNGGEHHTERPGFFQRAKESFVSNILHERRYMLILNGLKITILISILAALFGTLVGACICAMRMSRNRLVNGVAKVYIALFRGTPVLVALMLFFYVVFARSGIGAVTVAIITFGFNFGAYVSEMFRTSIESISRGQTEAGVAMGFTRVQTFIHIILPQMIRRVMPVYKGELISLVKMTSVVGYIAVEDLTKVSDIIRSRTFDAFFPLVMVAILYFLFSWLLTLGLDRLEIATDPQRRRKKRDNR